MAAAASLSAVTASTTLSLQRSSNSGKVTPSVVALPAFHGLKAGAVSGGELHARVAAQCVVASASASASRGVVSMVATPTTKQFVTTKSEETFTAAKVSEWLLMVFVLRVFLRFEIL